MLITRFRCKEGLTLAGFSPKAASRLLTPVVTLVFVGLVATIMGFDGLVCTGLNADLGDVTRGQSVEGTLRILNLAPASVTVMRPATCGCEPEAERLVTVPPLGTASLRVPLLIGGKERGLRHRRITLYARRGDTVRALTGLLTFRVR